jgi:O-6-methylguanine DNA methyltransferase
VLRETSAILKISGVEFPVTATAVGVTSLSTPCDVVKLFGKGRGYNLVMDDDADPAEEKMFLLAARFISGLLAGEKVKAPPVDLSGLPDFERRALEATVTIPRGEVRSYAWVAGKAGSPRGARATGQAMKKNPVPLIVPCHRVIDSAGTPGGYGGRLDVKRKLLELEGADELVTWKVSS